MGKKVKYTNRDIVYLVLGLLLLFVVGRLVPLGGGISRLGMEAICIFVGGILLISTGFGMIGPCLLIILAIIFSGYMTGDEIIAGTLGTGTVWQLFAVFLLVYALTESKADGVLARWILSRKSFAGKPILFTTVFFLTVSVLATIGSALASFLFAMTVMDAIADTIGYDNESLWKRAMATGIIICSSVGGGVLPFKGLAALIFNMFESSAYESGITINQIYYWIPAGITALLVPLLYAVLMPTVMRIPLDNLKNLEINNLIKKEEIRFSKRQAVTLFFVLVGLSYSIFPFIITPLNNSIIYSGIGQGFWLILMFVLLAAIHIDGAPLVNAEDVFRKSIHWDIILSVCAFTVAGGMISDPELGIRNILAEVVGKVFSDLPVPVFVFLIAFVSVVCTNFFSNTATAIIISTIVFPFVIDSGSRYGLNISCIIPAIVIPSLSAFLTVAAGGSAPIFHALPCIESKQGWLWKNAIILLLCIALPTTLSSVVCAQFLH